MAAQKLSKEQEKQIVQEYINGATAEQLAQKYGFKTRKSITDKIKKYYPESYKNIIEQARENKKSYTYTLEKIQSEFDAYYLGLLLKESLFMFFFEFW